MKKIILIFGTLLSITNFSFAQQQPFYDVTSGDGNGLRFSGSNQFKMSLGGFTNPTQYRYGPVNVLSIKMNVQDLAGINKSGWTWGSEGAVPIAALDTRGNMQIERNFVALGNMGIGITSPTAKLHVVGESRFDVGQNKNIGISDWVLAGPETVTINTYNDDHSAHVPLALAASKFYFHSGNVGIGTTKTNGYKLSVEGKMRAREIEVNADVWADYVFDKDYKLIPLAEVEKFIQENNHLPNIPSAKEVVEEGLNLGEMQVKMMEKIEELTLYIIELEKKIEQNRNQ